MSDILNKIMYADGKKKDFFPKDGKQFEISEFYDALGTDIIRCLWGEDFVFVVDEEGLLKKDPRPNREATGLLWKMIPQHNGWTYLFDSIILIERKYYGD